MIDPFIGVNSLRPSHLCSDYLFQEDLVKHNEGTHGTIITMTL